jgi:hypothetical protein
MFLSFIQSTVKGLSILFRDGKCVVTDVEVKASRFGIWKECDQAAAINIEDRVRWIQGT